MDDVEIKNWWHSLISSGFWLEKFIILKSVHHLLLSTMGTMGVQNDAVEFHSIKQADEYHIFYARSKSRKNVIRILFQPSKLIRFGLAILSA